MSTCSNCYSGCVEIQSDKCVKYTGLGVEVLGIQNGDSVNYALAAIAGFLTSTLDGSGIKYELDPLDMCPIVSDELTDCTDITVVDITTALSNAICSLDALVAVNTADIAIIDGTFTPDCVPGIAGTEGAHAVIQAVINHLCTVATDLDALELDVSTNYVAIADIDTYIATYISNNPAGTGEKAKMIPYTIVEYYGPTSVFDASGAGLDKTGTGGLDWREIYMCNGENGTPDKRGRIAVGTTSGMGGGAFPNSTDPLVSGNPTYLLYTTTGSNTVTLTTAQLPAHSHTGSTTNTGDHYHFNATTETAGNNSDPTLNSTGYMKRALGEDTVSQNYILMTTTTLPTVGRTSLTGDHNHSVTIDAFGGGNSHNNIPPVLACHYIMYIPTV